MVALNDLLLSLMFFFVLKMNLENCITLKCKEILNDGQDVKHREYSLAELQELQNKLMLITVSVKNREDEITTYTEVC